MKRILLVHGWGGTHPKHWQAWLQKELEKSGHEVFFPLLPKADDPIETDWVNEILKLPVKWDSNTILVGHSLGVPTILRCLEKLKPSQKIGEAILVAGFCRDLKIPEIANFVNHPFDWNKIKKQCAKFVAIISDNDPYVPLYQSMFVCERLGIVPIIEKNGGHITAPQFGPYPKLLELILTE
ncbi:MAG: alpha/beta hydrolase [Candidatus Micrarchaeota archaeon]